MKKSSSSSNKVRKVKSKASSSADAEREPAGSGVSAEVLAQLSDTKKVITVAARDAATPTVTVFADRAEVTRTS